MWLNWLTLLRMRAAFPPLWSQRCGGGCSSSSLCGLSLQGLPCTSQEPGSPLPFWGCRRVPLARPAAGRLSDFFRCHLLVRSSHHSILSEQKVSALLSLESEMEALDAEQSPSWHHLCQISQRVTLAQVCRCRENSPQGQGKGRLCLAKGLRGTSQAGFPCSLLLFFSISWGSIMHSIIHIKIQSPQLHNPGPEDSPLCPQTRAHGHSEWGPRAFCSEITSILHAAP